MSNNTYKTENKTRNEKEKQKNKNILLDLSDLTIAKKC